MMRPSNVTASGRYCSRCGTHKPKAAYYVCRKSPDGRQAACMECMKADRRLARHVERSVKAAHPAPAFRDSERTTRVGLLDLPA